jgi:hypothetical protein
MYPFRLGRRPTADEVATVAYRNVHPFEDEITQGEFHAQGATALRAIRGRCFDCSGYRVKEVRECKFANCSLWSFRFGKNPNRALSGDALEIARTRGAKLASERHPSKSNG